MKPIRKGIGEAGFISGSETRQKVRHRSVTQRLRRFFHRWADTLDNTDQDERNEIGVKDRTWAIHIPSGHRIASGPARCRRRST